MEKFIMIGIIAVVGYLFITVIIALFIAFYKQIKIKDTILYLLAWPLYIIFWILSAILDFEKRSSYYN